MEVTNIIVTSPLNFNTLNGLETAEITVFDGSGGQDSQTVEITVNQLMMLQQLLIVLNLLMKILKLLFHLMEMTLMVMI